MLCFWVKAFDLETLEGNRYALKAVSVCDRHKLIAVNACCSAEPGPWMSTGYYAMYVFSFGLQHRLSPQNMSVSSRKRLLTS